MDIYKPLLTKSEVRKLWTDALKSGIYKQTQEALEDEEGFCCLGVLCHLFHENVKPIRQIVDGNIKYDGELGSLPTCVMEWAGIHNQDGNYLSGSLVDLNDNDKESFMAIAEVIESEPEGLFVEPSGA